MQSSEITVPRWVYVLMAMVTASIGLAASGVTAKFFILGLDRLESDPVARSLLALTGALMIITELAAFGIAALLPTNQLRAMRRTLLVCGALLLSFEAATIYLTQAAIDQAHETEASSTAARIAELQTTIQGRRDVAVALRTNGTAQSTSSNGWTRTLGANALRDALKVEEQIAPLANELALLQANRKTTLSGVLGQTGSHVYGLVRGLLISTMGLVMFGAAGALLREGLRAKGSPAADVRTTQSVVRNMPPNLLGHSTISWWTAATRVVKGWCGRKQEAPVQLQASRPKLLKRA